MRRALWVAQIGLLVGCSAQTTFVEPPQPREAAPAQVCRLEDWNDAAQLPQLRLGHERAVDTAVLSPGHHWVATAGSDGHRLWELPTGRLVRTELPGITFCDDDHVAGVEPDAVVSLQLSSGALTRTPRVEGDLPSPDGCQLARSTPDALRFFDTRTGRELAAQPSKHADLSDSSVDALFEVVRGEHHETWSWANHKAIEPLTSDRPLQGQLTLSADHRFACLASFKGARVLDLTTGKVAFEQRTTGDAGSFSSGMRVPTISACELARDGSRVAIAAIRPGGFRGFAASDYRISVFDLGGKKIATLDRLGVMGAAFSDDARSLQIDTRHDMDNRSDRCERVDLASKASLPCEAQPARHTQGVTLAPDGRVTVSLAAQAYTFDTVRTWDRDRLVASPMAAPNTTPRLMVRLDGDVSHIVELPSLRWRGTVPTKREPLWLGSDAILFDDGPGRILGYRLDGCAVMRLAGLRVGTTNTFVAASHGALQADAMARTFLVGDPRPFEEDLVGRFLMAP